MELWKPERIERKRHTLKTARNMAWLFGDAAKVSFRGDGKPAVEVYGVDPENAEPYAVAVSLYQDETVDKLHREVANVRSNVEGFTLNV